MSDLYGATSLPELSPDPALRSSAPVPPAAPATGARSSYGKVNAPMRPAPPAVAVPSVRRNRGSGPPASCLSARARPAAADLNMMELLVIHRSGLPGLRRLPTEKKRGGRDGRGERRRGGGSDNISSTSSDRRPIRRWLFKEVSSVWAPSLSIDTLSLGNDSIVAVPSLHPSIHPTNLSKSGRRKLRWSPNWRRQVRYVAPPPRSAP